MVTKRINSGGAWKIVSEHAKNIYSLENFSYVYLALPVMMFLSSWLRPMPALLMSTSLILISYWIWKNHLSSTPIPFLWTSFPLEFVVAVAAVWTFLSGAGGYVFQNIDWVKHNSILFHLSTSSWPVILSDPDKHSNSIYLLYYFAYYLPAGLVGHVTGLNGATFTLLLWTFVGVVLSLLWFIRLVGKFNWTVVSLFICFGGMSFLGYVFTQGRLPTGNSDMDWWAGIWQYYDNTASLFWVPQHSLGGWIATSLIIFEGWERRSSRNAIAILSLTPYWSPFVTVGLTPIVCLLMWQNRKSDVFSPQNVLSLPVIGVAVCFFSANLAVSGEGTHTGWVWTFLSLAEQWPRLILFYAVSFGVYAATAWNLLKPICSGAIWQLWLISVASLTLIPLFAMGNIVLPDTLANDFCMRSSIPALFAFAICLGKVLVQTYTSEFVNFQRSMLIACLIIGSFGAFAQISRTIQKSSAFRPRYTPIWDQPPGFRHQYYGNTRSTMLHYIFKTTNHEPPRRTGPIAGL